MIIQPVIILDKYNERLIARSERDDRLISQLNGKSIIDHYINEVNNVRVNENIEIKDLMFIADLDRSREIRQLLLDRGYDDMAILSTQTIDSGAFLLTCVSHYIENKRKSDTYLLVLPLRHAYTLSEVNNTLESVTKAPFDKEVAILAHDSDATDYIFSYVNVGELVSVNRSNEIPYIAKTIETRVAQNMAIEYERSGSYLIWDGLVLVKPKAWLAILKEVKPEILSQSRQALESLQMIRNINRLGEIEKSQEEDIFIEDVFAYQTRSRSETVLWVYRITAHFVDTGDKLSYIQELYEKIHEAYYPEFSRLDNGENEEELDPEEELHYKSKQIDNNEEVDFIIDNSCIMESDGKYLVVPEETDDLFLWLYHVVKFLSLLFCHAVMPVLTPILVGVLYYRYIFTGVMVVLGFLAIFLWYWLSPEHAMIIAPCFYALVFWANSRRNRTDRHRPIIFNRETQLVYVPPYGRFRDRVVPFKDVECHMIYYEKSFSAPISVLFVRSNKYNNFYRGYKLPFSYSIYLRKKEILTRYYWVSIKGFMNKNYSIPKNRPYSKSIEWYNQNQVTMDQVKKQYKDPYLVPAAIEKGLSWKQLSKMRRLKALFYFQFQLKRELHALWNFFEPLWTDKKQHVFNIFYLSMWVLITFASVYDFLTSLVNSEYVGDVVNMEMVWQTIKAFWESELLGFSVGLSVLVAKRYRIVGVVLALVLAYYYITTVPVIGSAVVAAMIGMLISVLLIVRK